MGIRVSDRSDGVRRVTYMRHCPGVVARRIGCDAVGKGQNRSPSKSRIHTCLKVPTLDICDSGGQTSEADECIYWR